MPLAGPSQHCAPFRPMLVRRWVLPVGGLEGRGHESKVLLTIGAASRLSTMQKPSHVLPAWLARGHQRVRGVGQCCLLVQEQKTSAQVSFPLLTLSRHQPYDAALANRWHEARDSRFSQHVAAGTRPRTFIALNRQIWFRLPTMVAKIVRRRAGDVLGQKW